MQIKVEVRTGAVSVKLTQQEQRCLKNAAGICRAIGKNVNAEIAATAEQAIEVVMATCIDRAAT